MKPVTNFYNLTPVQQEYLFHVKVFGRIPDDATYNTTRALKERGLILDGSDFYTKVLTELGRDFVPVPGHEWIERQLKIKNEESKDAVRDMEYAKRRHQLCGQQILALNSIRENIPQDSSS